MLMPGTLWVVAGLPNLHVRGVFCFCKCTDSLLNIFGPLSLSIAQPLTPELWPSFPSLAPRLGSSQLDRELSSLFLNEVPLLGADGAWGCILRWCRQLEKFQIPLHV